MNIYQKIHVWLNKKISLIFLKRSKCHEYVLLEKNILTFLLDGFIINLAVIRFIPISFTSLLSFGACSFIIKRVFPFIVQLFNSLNLIKVGK